MLKTFSYFCSLVFLSNVRLGRPVSRLSTANVPVSHNRWCKFVKSRWLGINLFGKRSSYILTAELALPPARPYTRCISAISPLVARSMPVPCHSRCSCCHTKRVFNCFYISCKRTIINMRFPWGCFYTISSTLRYLVSR